MRAFRPAFPLPYLVCALPDAAFAVDALRGYSMGQRLSGDWIEETGVIRGEHGYLMDCPEMQAGFFALGAGVRAGLELGVISLLDIAPTVCRALGMRMLGEGEGRVLDLAAA